MRLFRSARWLLLALLISLAPASSFAGIFVSVSFGPPVLPVYVQPPCPAPDLIWTPGYWAYGEMGYYWVPGAWVPAPFVGGLWTPGYWGWRNGLYVYNAGYWGYHVGYYGGVNYGGGYLGIGFAGGEWRGGHMAYNTAVINVNTTVVHTTFVDRTVIVSHTVDNPRHVAYAGGPGGIQHTATPEEQVAAHETHTPPTSFQSKHETSAAQDKTSWAKNNGGHPTNVAVAKPLPVETRTPPPHTNTAASKIGSPSGGAGKVAPEAGGGGHPASQTAISKRPENTTSTPKTEERAVTPSHPSTPARTNPAPRTNTAPKPSTAPRASAPPKPNPKPASKPSPSEHKK